MWIGFIILFILILWEGSVMSRRTRDLESRITDLEGQISELEDKSPRTYTEYGEE